MDREIKFRGLYKDEFVYGSLVKCIDVNGNDFYQIDNGQMIGHQVWTVDKETIGQYTGLKDENGKEIYEGDIVLLHERRNYKSVVSYDPEFLAFRIKGGYGLSIEELKVIGNIYEDPELLDK